LRYAGSPRTDSTELLIHPVIPVSRFEMTWGVFFLSMNEGYRWKK